MNRACASTSAVLLRKVSQSVKIGVNHVIPHPLYPAHLQEGLVMKTLKNNWLPITIQHHALDPNYHNHHKNNQWQPTDSKKMPVKAVFKFQTKILQPKS